MTEHRGVAAVRYRVKEGATHCGGYDVPSEHIGKIVVQNSGRVDWQEDILVSAVDTNAVFYVHKDFLEPVTEFKVGDRVRAESKTNDDVAEFTVTYVGTYDIDSETNSYPRSRFNFTLLTRKPEPLKVGDEVLIDDERIPRDALLVSDNLPMVKMRDAVVWANTHFKPPLNRPAKIVWLPES